MLPLDPAKHDEYRAKIREARARQVPTVPKGSKLSEEWRANISEASKNSAAHRSKNQRGANNARFTGKGWIHHTGYRYVTTEDGRQVPEHRDVMERVLGRRLLSHETVHHRNGDRLDNRSENLELWSTRNPKGQRIADKVEYALEILHTYCPELLSRRALLTAAPTDQSSVERQESTPCLPSAPE